MQNNNVYNPMKLSAKPGSAREVIIAMRQAALNQSPWPLYLEYERTPGRKHVGWCYFLNVCRQVDAFERWEKERGPSDA